VLHQLRELAPQIDPAALVGELSVGEQQQVELVKVLNLNAKLVILDEPTSVLTPAEAERLWALVRKLADDGRSVVFITHKLEDVTACADRVAVMRAGQIIETLDTKPFTAARLVGLMMGQDAAEKPIEVGAPVGPPARLTIRELAVSRHRMHLRGIDITLAGGEILGIAGVAGNGQSLLADAITGFAPLEAGEVILDGESIQTPDRSNPHDERIGYIPEHPVRNAVAGDLSNCVNLMLRHYGSVDFFPRWRSERDSAQALIRRFDVRPPLTELPSGRLSGGNLQKLVSARELAQQRKLVVACYPTMGLDVHAAEAVYAALFEQATGGASVVWISEDLDDLMRYAHRIAVLFDGRLVASVPARQADRHTLGGWMTGARAAA
jgi:simple sugar transport system ATP-binding protein